MTPNLQRTLRELRLPAFVALSFVVVATLVWSTRRLEKGRITSSSVQSVCARLVDEAFGLDGARTPDSVLLTRLLVHRSRCKGDPTYVDQARRLLLSVQRVDDARALLVDAERSRVFAGDALAAQRAWVDLEESRQAFRNGDVQRAATLRARLARTPHRLRDAWPEWAPPYVLLAELERSAPIEPEASRAVTENAYALERAAHRSVTTGAFIRSLNSRQTYAAVCALAALGMLGLGLAGSGAIASLGMRRMATVPVADAKVGYVELTGTLHLPPRADAVIAPLSKVSAVWYALETTFGSRGSHTWRDRSAQRFLLRDATGEVAIDPSGAVVRTRHVRSRFGDGAILLRRRETERMLRDGDVAYVVGELSLAKNRSGVVERAVRAPEDGRPLLVSNYTEAELIGQERIWVWSGALLSALAVAALMWGYVQRFEVRVVP
ncbi:MAG TPA: GIDE domain-containing protein [Gemmatimonadaceae bacterium]